MQPVKIYTTRSCGFCARAKSFLQQRRVLYEEVDVSDDDKMREQLVAMTGGQRTVPQIFIGDRSIGGYTDLVALDQRGQLTSLLEGSEDLSEAGGLPGPMS